MRRASIAILVVVAVIACSRTSTGSRQEQRDVSVGLLKVKLVGLPLPDDADFRRELRSKFGIETVNLGSEAGSPEAKDADDYNFVSREAMRRRFGRDVVRETFDQAKRRWESERLPGVTNEPDGFSRWPVSRFFLLSRRATNPHS